MKYLQEESFTCRPDLDDFWKFKQREAGGQSQLDTPSSVTDLYFYNHFQKLKIVLLKQQTANLTINILNGQSSKEMKRESKSPDSLIKTPVLWVVEVEETL